MKTFGLRIVLLAAALQAPADAASFDCRKARTGLEHRICDDPALGKADEELAQVFRETLRVFVIPDFIKDLQRAWLYSAPLCLDAKADDAGVLRIVSICFARGSRP